MAGLAIRAFDELAERDPGRRSNSDWIWDIAIAQALAGKEFCDQLGEDFDG